MASSFTLSSSESSIFTPRLPAPQPRHPHHFSLAFPYHAFNVQPPITNSAVIVKANLGSEFPKSERRVVNSNLKEEKFTHQGLVTESLPNGMFRVRLENEDMIIGYVSGKIRSKVIRITPGDKVKVEISRYDSTRGRIVYRIDRERENNLGPNKGGTGKRKGGK